MARRAKGQDGAARMLERAIAIHRDLNAGREVAKQDLARRFRVHPRTIQRTLRLLQKEGAPIGTGGRAGSFRYTERGWTFAPYWIDPAELFALMVAEQAVAQYEGTDLHAPLRSAFARLLKRLPPETQRLHQPVTAAIHFGGLPPPRIDPDVWVVLLAAIQEHTAVQLSYQKLGGSPELRTIHPYQLLARDRDWFLVAHRPDKRREVLYYLPRIRSAAPTGKPFAVRRGFDFGRFHAQAFNAMQGPSRPVTVELRFPPDVAQLASERRWASDQVERRDRDGSAVIRFRSAALFEVARQVLRYEGRVEVRKPASLRQQIAQTAREIAARHGG